MKNKKYIIAYAIFTIVNIMIFVYYYTSDNSVTSSYEDGGDGLTLVRKTFDGKEHIKFINNDYETVINLDRVDFGGECIQVWPFKNGYSKVAVVEDHGTTSNPYVKYCFLNLDGEVAFEIKLQNVPVKHLNGNNFIYNEEELFHRSKAYSYYGISNVYNEKIVVIERIKNESGMVSVYDTNGTLLNSKDLGSDYDKKYFKFADYDKPYTKDIELDEIGFTVNELDGVQKERYMDTDLNIVEQFDKPEILSIYGVEDDLVHVMMWNTDKGDKYQSYLDFNGQEVNK